MTSMVQSNYSEEHVSAWLRGLLAIAWADGDFDAQEQELIASITQNELAPGMKMDTLEDISPEELADVLGKGTPLAENFLRTAVMVAIADGIYTKSEDYMLHELCKALGEPDNILEALRYTLEHPEELKPAVSTSAAPTAPLKRPVDPLHPLRDWLDGLEIQDPSVARFLCKMIPSQCPFARDVKLFGRKIVHIPPLCKINPLYEQLVGLRFRALSYLADECKEDVTPYI
ncbi:Mo-dependent nitrogenase family protein [Calothrix sp. NIES-4101]|nr:Mo-dependent nitrogenase family protein [Calothrix sp. NIES-4101]